MNAGERFSVIDTKNFSVKTYEVQQVGSPFEPIMAPVAVSTSNFAKDTANIIQAEVRRVESADVIIPSTLPNSPESGDMSSAIKMMTSGSQRSVANYAKDHLRVDTAFGALVGSLLKAFGKFTDVQITITVKFSDNSTATFQTTGINADGTLEWQYQEGSAFTEDGVAIPTKQEDILNKDWLMTEAQLNNGYQRVAEDFGWIILQGQQCRPFTYVVCTNIGQEVTCTRFSSCR